MAREPNKPINKVINVIIGGLVGGESNTSWKAYVRLVHNISLETKKAKTGEPIVFSDDDLKEINTPYDDVIVITVIIENFEVHKMMIKSGSATNVLFFNTFFRMKLPENKLKPV